MLVGVYDGGCWYRDGIIEKVVCMERVAWR